MAYSNIDKPSKYFNTLTWTGNGSTRNITGTGFDPNFVWIKNRSNGTRYHVLNDSVRGANKQLFSNVTNAEETDTGQLTAFITDGFSLGTNANVNTNGDLYASWNWLANSSSSSNTSGSISSTVSANTTSGFSIVSYTATSGASSIGHGLGVAPKMIILKARGQSSGWVTGFSVLGWNKYLEISDTDAVITDRRMFSPTAGTDPTSTLFWSDQSAIASAGTMIAYCFANVKGFSQFGSWTGNGNADGTFVYLGFKPEFVMLKNASGTNQWLIFDNTREPANIMGDYLEANSSASQSTFDGFDFLSNGMKMRTSNTAWNASGNTYIYMAFAKNPFVSSKGIPTTAR